MAQGYEGGWSYEQDRHPRPGSPGSGWCLAYSGSGCWWDSRWRGGLVAALTLGAVGVWCGTIFLSTYEANIHDYHKGKILEATEEDTRVTKFYTGKTARLIDNKWFQAWGKSDMTPLPYPLQGLLIAEAQQGLRNISLTDSGYAGQICGIIREVKSAKQVVEEIVEGAIRILKGMLPTRSSSLWVSKGERQQMDFELTEEQKMSRQVMRRFCENEIAPLVEEKERFPQELFTKMGRLGYLCIRYSEKYGGAEVDKVADVLCREEMSRIC